VSLIDKLKHQADELGLREKASHLMEEAKKVAGQAKEKAGDLAVDNRARVEGALDKAGAKIDEKTEGKYADKIAKAKSQVTKGVDKIAEGSSRTSGTGPASTGGTGTTWGGAATAGGAAAAGPTPAGGFDPLIDEEEVAEEALSVDLDPEAPLDAPPEAAVGLAGARPQRAYDASGEPIDDLPLEPDAPDVPGAAPSSGSW
jgi:uncharacterized protein YjbJ (UPF0337 family)